MNHYQLKIQLIRSIQFTMEYSKNEKPFLDIFIKRNETGIWIDVYHKPTDTQISLPFISNHPNHCKRNIPFCLARTIFTIAESNVEKLRNLENLKSNLSKYHYPDLLIRQGIQEALHIPQQNLRRPKETSAGNILSFKTTLWPKWAKHL